MTSIPHGRTGLAVAMALTLGACALPVGSSESALGAGSFEPVSAFGTNPAGLRMFRYVPSPEPSGPAPLVVVMHGCTQNAMQYRAAGWEELADELGFYVVYPEQTSDNNPISCFNWAGVYGDDTNLRRGEGENESIREMVVHMQDQHAIDPRRIYIAGHSAGAASAVVQIATTPEIFAGAGVIAGIPYRCATDVNGAFGCQSSGRDESPSAWGDLVRAANPGGPYPVVSFWHGTNDFTVTPKNTEELIEQWTDVHGIDQEPDVEEMRDGAMYRGYQDGAGSTLVEFYEVVGGGHATFNDPDNGCGSIGGFMEDRDICSARKMAELWGLDTDGPGPGPGTSPGTDPGTNPGTDPGTNPDPGTGPGTDPGSSPNPGGAPGADGHECVETAEVSGGCSTSGSAPLSAVVAMLGLARLRRRRR